MVEGGGIPHAIAHPGIVHPARIMPKPGTTLKVSLPDNGGGAPKNLGTITREAPPTTPTPTDTTPAAGPTPGTPDAEAIPEPAQTPEQAVRKNVERQTQTIFKTLTARDIQATAVTMYDEGHRTPEAQAAYLAKNAYEAVIMRIDTYQTLPDTPDGTLLSMPLNTGVFNGRNLIMLDSVRGGMMMCRVQAIGPDGQPAVDADNKPILEPEAVSLTRQQLVDVTITANRTTIESHYDGRADTQQLVINHIDNLSRDPNAPEPTIAESDLAADLNERVTAKEGAGIRDESLGNMARRMLRERLLPHNANEGTAAFYKSQNERNAARLDQVEELLLNRRAGGLRIADAQTVIQVFRLAGIDVDSIGTHRAAFAEQADALDKMISQGRSKGGVTNPDTGRKATRQEIDYWEAQRDDAIDNRDMCDLVAEDLGDTNFVTEFYRGLDNGEYSAETVTNFERAVSTGDETAMIKVIKPDYDPDNADTTKLTVAQQEKMNKITSLAKKGGLIGLGLSILVGFTIFGASRRDGGGAG